MSIKNRYTIYLVVLSAVLTAFLLIFGSKFFESSSAIRGLGLAIALLTGLELFSIWFLETKSEKLNPQQSVNFFMGMKVGRIILALLFIAVYAIAIKVETKHFIGIFLVVYMLYLMYNTFYLMKREKRLKGRIKKNDYCNDTDL